MRPRHIPTLKGEDAKSFIKQDKKRLSREQKEHLEECSEVYKKNPIR